jgi:hypothetical protein
MIKKILGEISKDLYRDDEKHGIILKYKKMQEHEGWKSHQIFVAMIANKMSECMFSKEFTNLNKDDKDAYQRSFSITKEIIDFLFDPLKGAENYAKIMAYNKNLGATKKGATKKEKKT